MPLGVGVSTEVVMAGIRTRTGKHRRRRVGGAEVGVGVGARVRVIYPRKLTLQLKGRDLGLGLGSAGGVWAVGLGLRLPIFSIAVVSRRRCGCISVDTTRRCPRYIAVVHAFTVYMCTPPRCACCDCGSPKLTINCLFWSSKIIIPVYLFS